MGAAMYCNSPSKTAKFGQYAFFPGTGPEGKTCTSCMFCELPKNADINKPSSCRKAKCHRWGIMRGGRAAGQIDATVDACKFWAAG